MARFLRWLRTNVMFGASDDFCAKERAWEASARGKMESSRGAFESLDRAKKSGGNILGELGGDAAWAFAKDELAKATAAWEKAHNALNRCSTRFN